MLADLALFEAGITEPVYAPVHPEATDERLKVLALTAMTRLPGRGQIG